MGGSSKKKWSKDEQDEKDRNRSNKGKSIGGWTEDQMQAAYNE